MITPAIRGGHEVTQPVAVEGAEVGDAIVIRIKDVAVTSMATASGNDQWMEGRFFGDPYVAGRCPGCGLLYPETRIDGIGPTAIRCVGCGADATPFTFTNGYTIVFDDNRSVGVTVAKKAAEKIARDANRFAAMPENSQQNSVLVFAPNDIVGMVVADGRRPVRRYGWADAAAGRPAGRRDGPAAGGVGPLNAFLLLGGIGLKMLKESRELREEVALDGAAFGSGCSRAWRSPRASTRSRPGSRCRCWARRSGSRA